MKNGEITFYLSARWDAGTHFEKELKSDGSAEYRHYINAPTGPVAVHSVKVAGASVTRTTSYLHKDHLGSVDAISNESGTVVERFRYDPFGKQQTTLGTNTVTHHGYTGHEMLNDVGLIHMNGRVYDPNLGRFLQADPVVQSAKNVQSFNRYSYLLNSPLSFTDTSGFVGEYDICSDGTYAPPGNCPPSTPAVGSGGGSSSGGSGGGGSNGGDTASGPPSGGGDTAADASDTQSGFDEFWEEPVYDTSDDTGSLLADSGADTYYDPYTGVAVDEYGNVVDTSNMVADSGMIMNDASPGMGITNEQQQFAAEGRTREFWKSRLAMGDPVAGIALESLDPSGGPIDSLFGGASVNNRLQAFARVYVGNELNVDEVRVRLMDAHIKAVTSDTQGVRGLLNPVQIAAYHHQVFAGYRLPATAFGGTPFTGALWEANATRGIWCMGCDWR